MFEAVRRYPYFLINFYIVLSNIHLITCLPTVSRNLCYVALDPKNIYAEKNHASFSAIKCTAYLPQELQSNLQGIQFVNPVFDLSFGNNPRTGIFFLRGNHSECNERRNACWSEFSVKTGSLSHLFPYKESIPVTCKVADQPKHIHLNIGSARCENNSTLHLDRVQRFEESCLPSSSFSEEMCDKNMICRRVSAHEFDSEYKCVCADHFTEVRMSLQSIICAKEAKLNQSCEYTEQCMSLDNKTMCKLRDNGSRICECDHDSGFVQNEKNICVPALKRVPIMEAEAEINGTILDVDKSEPLISSGDSSGFTMHSEKHENYYVFLAFINIFYFYF